MCIHVSKYIYLGFFNFCLLTLIKILHLLIFLWELLFLFMLTYAIIYTKMILQCCGLILFYGNVNLFHSLLIHAFILSFVYLLPWDSYSFFYSLCFGFSDPWFFSPTSCCHSSLLPLCPIATHIAFVSPLSLSSFINGGWCQGLREAFRTWR